MHEDLDMEASVEELNALEEKFTNIVKERVAGNPELKFVFLVYKSDLDLFPVTRSVHSRQWSEMPLLRISRDAAYMENPMERENLEDVVSGN